MSYAIVNATTEHVKMLLDVMRAGDREECEAFGLSARAALWRSFRQSYIRKAAFVDGQIAAMWGVCGVPLGAHADIWLLTSPVVEAVPLLFVKEARREVEELLEIFPSVRGILCLDYLPAVRLVQLLGFTLHVLPDRPNFAIFERKRNGS